MSKILDALKYRIVELEEQIAKMREALIKNKSEWEAVSPDGYKHLVAWQVARNALARGEK